MATRATTTSKTTNTKASDIEVKLQDEFRKLATIIVTATQMYKGRGLVASLELAEHVVEKVYGTTGK